MQSPKTEQTDELLRAAQQARGTDTVEQLRWHDLAHYGTPCSDRSVLCWAEGAWQPGWYEPEAGWLDCVTGDRLQDVTHWSEPAGPQGNTEADELAQLRNQKDGAYLERNRCVALVARMAIALGLRVAVTKTAIEGWSEDWQNCIFIELPTGQVSWHFHASQAHLFEGLPHRPATWDGHDTPQKYLRVADAYRFTLPAAADGVCDAGQARLLPGRGLRPGHARGGLADQQTPQLGRGTQAMTPQRIQLSRVKGWRMPENTVKVDRTTRWGNPFRDSEHDPHGEASIELANGMRQIVADWWSAPIVVDLFEQWMSGQVVQDPSYLEPRPLVKGLLRPAPDLEPLRGKHLACWCKPGAPCHADVLLRLANAKGEQQ